MCIYHWNYHILASIGMVVVVEEVVMVVVVKVAVQAVVVEAGVGHQSTCPAGTTGVPANHYRPG